jgi:hypothetical protein
MGLDRDALIQILHEWLTRFQPADPDPGSDHLAEDEQAFWGSATEILPPLPPLPSNPPRPDTAAALLKRMGSPPFWPELETLGSWLETSYRQAGDAVEAEDSADDDA